jgi:hypothetical protein
MIYDTSKPESKINKLNKIGKNFPNIPRAVIKPNIFFCMPVFVDLTL